MVFENFSGAPTCDVATSDVNVCTRYQYDVAGNQVSVTLGNGSVTSYEYDALGRLVRERTDPDGVNIVTEHVYDAAGNEIQRIRNPGASAQITTFTYDALGRLLTTDYPDTTPDVAFTYDSFGNRATMVDGGGTWQYSYDALNRLLNVTSPSGPVVTYTYDAAGNRTDLNVTNGVSLAINYTYDDAGRLASISDPFAGGAARVDYVHDDAKSGYPGDTSQWRPNHLHLRCRAAADLCHGGGRHNPLRV